MSEDEQMARALRESMKSLTSEQEKQQHEPSPPPYDHTYPGDVSKDEDQGKSSNNL